MRLTLHVILLTAFVAAIPPVALRSQTPALVSRTLEGVVRASDGRPLHDAEVRLPELKRSTRTNKVGVWSLRDIPAGTHVLSVRQIGFAERRREVRIAPDQPTVPLADTLTTAAVRLDAVVISARRQVLGGTYDRIERGATTAVFAEDIAAIPTNLFDVSALISRSKLFGMSRFARRGTAACRQNVFIDGSPLPEHLRLNDWIGPYEIEAIELTRGRAALLGEDRRRARGDSTGVTLDRAVGSCEWVWLIWSKKFTRTGRRHP
jgi:hypothetical protein